MRITIHVEGDTMAEVLDQLLAITPALTRAAAVDMATAAEVMAALAQEHAEEHEEPEAKGEQPDPGEMKDEALALLQKAFTTNRAGVQAIQKRFGVKKFADVPVEKAAELLREAKAL